MEMPKKKETIIGQPEAYGYNEACDAWGTYFHLEMKKKDKEIKALKAKVTKKKQRHKAGWE